MGETNFHFKDDFFEEILNGIPQSEEDKKDYLKKIEKNAKTSLSPDNKTRINRVTASFLTSEESKKAFLELIKNSKKREQEKFLKEIKKSILISKMEIDDDVEEEITEEVSAEENKSGGVFSKALEMKKKYQNIKGHAKTARKIMVMANLIKETYETLSNITTNNALKAKDGVVRKMNKTTNDFLEGNIGGLFHNVILPSSAKSITTIMDTIKTKFDKALSKFNIYLYEAVSVAMKAFTLIVLSIAAGGGALAAGATISSAAGAASWGYTISSVIMDMGSGDISPRKLFDAIVKAVGGKVLNIANLLEKGGEAIYSIWEAREKIKNSYKYISMGVGAFLGHYGEAEKELNDRLQDVGKSLSLMGDEIIDSYTNKDGLSLTENFQMASKVSHDVFEEGSLLIKQEFRGLDAKIKFKVDEMTSMQDKYNFAYEVISRSYFKGVEMSPWSKSARLIRKFVKYLHNSFIDIYEPLDTIVNNQSHFYNSKGQIVDLSKYISKIISNFENGVVVTTRDGKKRDLKLKRNKKREPLSKNPSNPDKFFKINIYTKQSVKSRYNFNASESILTSSSYKNVYEPVLKIQNPSKKKLNFKSDFIFLNGKNTNLKKISFENPKSSFYDLKNIKNNIFYDKINEEKTSPKIIFLRELFDYKIKENVYNSGSNIYFDEDFHGKYIDSKYMKYFSFVTITEDMVDEEENGKMIKKMGKKKPLFDELKELLNTKYGTGIPEGSSLSYLGPNDAWTLTAKGYNTNEIGYNLISNLPNKNNRLFHWSKGSLLGGYSIRAYEKGKEMTFMKLMYSDLLMENYISHRFKNITENHDSTINLLKLSHNKLK